MKVLVACEESQAVCKAFREKGHEAYSCDIIDCSGGHPEWHIKGDVLKILNPQKYKVLTTKTGDDNGVRAWRGIAHNQKTASKTFEGVAKAMAEQWG